MKDSVIIYREWKEALSELDIVERCQAYEAIMDYAFEGIIPEDKLIKSITALMRQRIDKDQEKYKETCSKRAEAGRLGGLRKKANSDERNSLANAINCQQMLPNASEAKQSLANLANLAEYDYEYDYDNIGNKLPDIIKAEKQIFGDNGFEGWKESIMKFQKLKESDFARYSFQFAKEAPCRNWTIGSCNCRSLFYTWVTNQIESKNNGGIKQDRFQQRRGTETNAASSKDYDETF